MALQAAFKCGAEGCEESDVTMSFSHYQMGSQKGEDRSVIMLGINLEVQVVHAARNPIANLQRVMDSARQLSFFPPDFFNSHSALKRFSYLFREPLRGTVHQQLASPLASPVTMDGREEKESSMGLRIWGQWLL